MKSLQRRVLMTLLGAPDRVPSTSIPARYFERFSLYRRVVAGLFGVTLDRRLVQGNLLEVEPRPSSEVRSLGAVVGSGTSSLVAPEEEAGHHEPPLVPYLLGHPLPNTSEADNPHSDAEIVEHLSVRPERPRDRTALRRGAHLLQPAAVGALVMALILGGVWYALDYRDQGDRDSTPYGSVIAIIEPLKDGDCVLADWPGIARFQGTPKLTLDPTCRNKVPDGQVMAVIEAATAAEAGSRGVRQCEDRTREIRDKLADARSFAVIPTRATFEAAGRRIACLVLGAHGPMYGPIGSYRRLGSAFPDTATMQIGDCLDVPSNRAARLVACTGKHDQQVLGFTRLGKDVTLAEARTNSDVACAKDMPPRDYGFDPSVYTAASWTSEGSWKSGTHFVVCTVRKENGGTIEGEGT